MRVLILQIIALASIATAQNKVICYYSSWATYRPGLGNFEVENIDPFLCTHAIYAFIDLNEDGTIKILDPYNDIDRGGFQRFNDLRNVNANLKTIIAIGGWNANSTIYSHVVGDPVLRASFVTNLYNFVKQYNFNGLDLDWEYPAERGGAPEDKANFVLLITELRALFGPEGLLLSAAVGANVALTTTSYDVPQLAANLDFINLMTYDFHGPWDNVTGLHSGLYKSSADPDPNLNADATVRNWIAQGAPAQKLNIGIAVYGKTFTLENAQNNGIMATTIGGGNAGPYTLAEGTLGFNEICEYILQGGWSENWDIDAQTVYSYKNDQWMCYDNYEAARLKAVYARNRFLGGAIIWSIDTDDFRNTCGLGAYPLLTIVKETILGA